MWFLWLPIKELLGICGRLNFLSVGQNNKKKILPRTSSEFLPLTWDVLPSHSPHPSAHHLALWACSRIPLPPSLPPSSLLFLYFLSPSPCPSIYFSRTLWPSLPASLRWISCQRRLSQKQVWVTHSQLWGCSTPLQWLTPPLPPSPDWPFSRAFQS